MTDERITIHDCRRVGHCVRGVRDWFQEHGLDFRAFMQHGIDERTFIEKGDALSAQIVAAKKGRGQG